ncbi:MAG TPA: archaemetzincin family Zn-dependent metalloprotease [Longimicrobiales bacterium]
MRAERGRDHEIRLVPLGERANDVLPPLGPPLARQFHARIRIERPIEIRPEWYDAQRGQYRADPILDTLITLHTPNDWILGILDEDLYAPGLSFIFGQATVAGCCALIGTARLRPEFYDAAPDPRLFQRRVLTEATHELGHVAGLHHCPDPHCVMHFSSTLEETDVKGTDFCARCSSARADGISIGSRPPPGSGAR